MPYTSRPLTILIVEDNEGDFVLFEAYLRQTNLRIKNIYHAKALSETGIEAENVDLAFLDLSLPDSGGLESFRFLNEQFPHVPIVVLSGLADEEIALQCIMLGAQDYLLKNELNERFLEKSINYSIERKKTLEEIRTINRQYELIGNVTEDVIWNWDLETQTLTYGKKAFLGYRQEEIANTLDWWCDKVHPEDRPRVMQTIHSVVERREGDIQFDYRFRAADDTYQFMYSKGVLLPVKNKAKGHMIGAMMNLTEQKKLQDELVAAQINFQRQMTEAMLLGQEKQKEEIGKELHDNINQILASVKLYIETAISNAALKDDLLLTSRKNVMYAIDEIRRLSHSLVPPTFQERGLVETVRSLVEELNSLGHFQISVTVQNVDEEALDAARKLVLYRIIQEQLSNVIKYAKAQEVWLTLQMVNSTLSLTVRDNGVGFDMAKKSKGIGLRNIESRAAYYAGSVALHSAPQKGTTLTVSLPL